MDTFMTHEGVVAAENNMKAFIAAGGDPSRVAVTTDPAEAEKVSRLRNQSHARYPRFKAPKRSTHGQLRLFTRGN